jgi:16S rRNA (guanine(527)-N(7))-methyltransferase RsmG
MPTPLERFKDALQKSSTDFDVQLDRGTITKLGEYYELLAKWNLRLHLVAPCSPELFATRHVLESRFHFQNQRGGGSLGDVGCGGGLPAIPCMIAMPGLQGALIESSQRKAVFLKETVRNLSLRGTVIARRFEDVPANDAEYVTCRALEQLGRKFPALVRWSPPKSTLLLLAGDALHAQIERAGLKFSAFKIPTSERRFLFVIDRKDSLSI